MHNVKAIQKINEAELRMGLDAKSSWHDQYKDSAYIFIGGLNYDLTEGDILSVFSQYGEIVNINLVRDKKTGKAKGFCFLAYEDQRSTVLAVDNFNGIKLCGRTLRVDHVRQYRRPKDEDGNEIIEKGCAPKTPTPSPSPSASPSPEPSPPQKVKKKKKKKDKKLKKKKHASRSPASSDGEGGSNPKTKGTKEKMKHRHDKERDRSSSPDIRRGRSSPHKSRRQDFSMQSSERDRSPGTGYDQRRTFQARDSGRSEKKRRYEFVPRERSRSRSPHKRI